MYPAKYDLRLIADAATELRSHIKKWANEVDNYAITGSNLCGACGISSHILSRVLRSVGVRTELRYSRYDWGGHCWLVLPGTELVVDITATQFQRDVPVKIPDVVLAPDWEYPAIYRRGDILTHFKTARYLYDWEVQSPYYPAYQERLHSIYRNVAKKLARRKYWSLMSA